MEVFHFSNRTPYFTSFEVVVFVGIRTDPPKIRALVSTDDETVESTPSPVCRIILDPEFCDLAVNHVGDLTKRVGATHQKSNSQHPGYLGRHEQELSGRCKVMFYLLASAKNCHFDGCYFRRYRIFSKFNDESNLGSEDAGSSSPGTGHERVTPMKERNQHIPIAVI